MSVRIQSIRLNIFLLILLFTGLSGNGLAARYVIAEDSSVIGEVQVIEADPRETLVDMARRFGLGYDELKAANPDVDLWVPKKGQKIVLPTRYVLPDYPREGVIVNLAEMRLYYFPNEATGEKVVFTYPIGIGREGWNTPTGLTKIVQKTENPSWTVPESILAEHKASGDPIPKVFPPGPDNPLGAHAMRLGIPGYLIHGTNKPSGVGMRVSHGCIRMYPEDIAHVFELTDKGTQVAIIDEPYKVGYDKQQMFLEVHLPIEKDLSKPVNDLSSIVKGLVSMTGAPVSEELWARSNKIIKENSGLPEVLGKLPENVATRPAWFVQLGEFHSTQGAKRMATFFSGLKVATLLGAAPNNGYCRVLAGPYTLKSKAEGQLRKIQSRTGIQGLLLPKMQAQDIPHCSPQLN